MLIFSLAATRTIAERKLSIEIPAVLDSGILTAKPGAAFLKSSMILFSTSWCLPFRDFFKPDTGTRP